MSESAAAAPLQPFNFATMSGIFPGTRTQLWQRLRLLPLEGAQQSACWALLLWYDTPRACVLVCQNPETAQLDATPLLRLEEPAPANLQARLASALAERGWQLYNCGACAHWRLGAESPANALQLTADGLALGACSLRRAIGPMHAPNAVPPALQAQSHLALGCAHWQAAGADDNPSAAETMLPVARLPKIAETTESKLKPLARWRLRIKRRLSPPAPPSTLTDLLAERSGVGAGTEPCAVCQGRIANLGALTTASPEDDKETFSVWRCRICHSLYLSDWVDRWERVDSLETEERIFRIAPVEAAELLMLFASIPAAEHPEHRHERNAQRTWIHNEMAQRTPLSHIIKQGR